MLRVLVAMLAIAPGRVASDEALVDALWGEEWSRERERNLHTHVSALRRLLAAAEPDRGEESRLMRSGGGYRLSITDMEVDVGLFRSLAARGRAAARGGGNAAAAAAFAAALALWRGPALADAAGLCPRLAGDAAGLEDLRAAVLEDRVDCDLSLGRHAEVAAEGPGLVAQFPLRERLAGQVMVALWRAGRRGEALAVFDSTRRTLARDLGIGPGPELSGLHAKVLADDPSLAAPPTAPPAPPAPEAAAGPDAPGGRDVQGHVPPAPRQLPSAVGHFTGREVELKALDELLDAPVSPGGGVVVAAMRGMAGVGKTALAVHWAHTVARRFPDGQLYVNLRGFDPGAAPVPPDEVTGWFLAALGLPGPAIPANPQARAGLYRSVLADRKVLLLLDNARDAAQVRPLLAGGPGCLALVTSRNSMAGLAASAGARLSGLGQLDAHDAVRLLTARLGPERVAAEPGAVEQLVRLCAGLPLALSISAARAAESPETPLAALVAELEQETDRLDALDLSDDETSVRAVFSWSLLQVSDQADRMFALLGAHRGPDVSLPAAASLAALPPARARSVLHELVSASRVRYGAMLIDDPDDPRVRQRASDGLAHAQRALALHTENGYRGGVMWAHQYCAFHYARLGETELAHGHCEQALELATELGDTQGQSFARFMMGFTCQASGDLEGAIARFKQALDLVPDSGPSSQGPRAELLAELGETYQAAGDLSSARSAFEQAMEFYESLHHPAAGQLRARLDQLAANIRVPSRSAATTLSG